MDQENIQIVLETASDDEIRGLRRLLWNPEDEEVLILRRDDILDQLRWLASSTLGYLFKGTGCKFQPPQNARRLMSVKARSLKPR